MCIVSCLTVLRRSCILFIFGFKIRPSGAGPRRAPPGAMAAAAAQFSGRSISWLEIHDQTATSYCFEQCFQSESDCMTRQAAPAPRRRRRPRTGP